MMNKKEVIINAFEACHCIRLLHLHGSITGQVCCAMHAKRQRRNFVMVNCLTFHLFLHNMKYVEKRNQVAKETKFSIEPWNVC